MQKGRQWQTCWQKQGWQRTPVECFKGHLEGDSTWNWPQSLNKLKTTVTCRRVLGGRTFLLSKKKLVQSWKLSSTAGETTEITMLDAQPENVSNKIMRVITN